MILRIIYRLLILFLLTLFLCEVGGGFYFISEYGVTYYIENFVIIQKSILSLSIGKGILLILIGDVFSGGFFKYVRSG
ncbi:hypothetical protein A1D23_00530 [Chelonobacter oris]|uniref:hypothetical protein n=1 Tax=Chelonobacter oris TaxID=505317 RepID=UPI00244ACDAE|nr:hypothetical protein [Chelonobacter oris]MDH3000050.1 hypothetical protein [Chelonobacter oris]